ncbi:hypothetical protein D3C72_1026460 [compost metagenome]
MHLVEGKHAGRVQQAELLDFLVRSEQVAFHLVGDELERAAPGLARFHALLLQAQPLAHPGRQPRTIHRIDLDRHAGGLQRLEPRRLGRREIKPGQRDEHHHIWRRLGRHGAQRLAAILAGLAGRDAQFHDFPVAEQRHRLLGLHQLAPVEAALGHKHVPLGKAGLARGAAQPVHCLEHQQVFVAMHDVQRRHALGLGLLQVRIESVELQLHRGAGRGRAALR